MRRRILASLILAGTLSISTGCAVFQSAQEATWETMRAFAPRATDYRNPADEVDDEWAIVGQEGRGHRPIERDPDPWWQKYVMSAKARSIERNFGIR